MPKVDPENVAAVKRILKRKLAAPPGTKSEETPYYRDESATIAELTQGEQRAVEDAQRAQARELMTKFGERAKVSEKGDISNEELAQLARRNLKEEQRLMDLLVAKEFAKTIPLELQGLPGLAPSKIEDVVRVGEDMGISDEPEVTFGQAVAREIEKWKRKK